MYTPCTDNCMVNCNDCGYCWFDDIEREWYFDECFKITLDIEDEYIVGRILKFDGGEVYIY